MASWVQLQYKTCIHKQNEQRPSVQSPICSLLFLSSILVIPHPPHPPPPPGHAPQTAGRGIGLRTSTEPRVISVHPTIYTNEEVCQYLCREQENQSMKGDGYTHQDQLRLQTTHPKGPSSNLPSPRKATQAPGRRLGCYWVTASEIMYYDRDKRAEGRINKIARNSPNLSLPIAYPSNGSTRVPGGRKCSYAYAAPSVPSSRPRRPFIGPQISFTPLSLG